MPSLPSGIRLVTLLNEHLNEIMDRERTNRTSIHLYCTGPYWVAFERSAYQLCLTFPDSAAASVRLPVPDRDGVRDGSLVAFVCP